MLRMRLFSTTALCPIVGLLLYSGVAQAADPYTKPPVADAGAPAVDGINGKVGGFAGSISKRSIYGAEGVLSVPLGGRYGLQVDGAGGSLGGRGFVSTAGHMFWRDPSVGLLGGYASYTHWNAFSGVNLGKYGVEGAWYAGRWTLEGVAGVESGTRKTDISGGNTTTIDLDTRGFDHITVSYYINDNFRLSAGHLYTGGRNALSLGAEAAFALGGGRMVSLFGEGRIGESGNHGILGGLKVYFGQRDKTLIRRHREDDPVTTLFDNIQGTGSGTNSAPTVTAAPPPPEF